MPRSFVSLIALLLSTLIAGCGNDDDRPPASAVTDTSQASSAASFQKEGTLAFLRNSDTLSTLDVEIAKTPQERERGLMQRPALPEGSGMIFLFDNERARGFWMKNTPMALDIFFVNADSQIVRVAKNTTPYSTERIESEAPAQFVVEVPAGYADRFGIVAGDRIRFRRSEEGASFGVEANARPDSLPSSARRR
jgi:uncharacterized membrane protein (UPF0127 family)